MRDRPRTGRRGLAQANGAERSRIIGKTEEHSDVRSECWDTEYRYFGFFKKTAKHFAAVNLLVNRGWS